MQKRNNYAAGLNNHKAKLTFHEVELVRQLREQGMSYGKIAEKFESGKSTIIDICMYRTRCYS